jgi:DNA topoisomerase IB
MLLYNYSPEELKQIFSEAIEEKLKAISGDQAKVYDFLDDHSARCIIAGSDKPISKETFNKLRREKKFNTYQGTEKRTLYSREELQTYIKSMKK